MSICAGTSYPLADLAFLCCPYSDHGDLRQIATNEIVCESCTRHFNVVKGCPILFDEDSSIFSPEEVAASADARQFPSDSVGVIKSDA
jgi:uncharacterized protein YbaR (Trm112 family)